MPPLGFEPRISSGERPHTYALDRAAIGAGIGMLEGRNVIQIKFVETKYNLS
jgi:hypothetical protein